MELEELTNITIQFDQFLELSENYEKYVRIQYCKKSPRSFYELEQNVLLQQTNGGRQNWRQPSVIKDTLQSE